MDRTEVSIEEKQDKLKNTVEFLKSVSHHWACSQILHQPHKRSDEIIIVFTAADSEWIK